MRFLILLVIALSIASCGGASEQSDEQPDSTSKESSYGTSLSEKYKLTPFTKSESFPDATIEFVGYENGEWNFKVEGSNYELGAQTSDVSSKGCANSAQGQHIHFIDGAAPYLAKYESSFKNEIDDGQHAILAFLSRSYHESIKTDGAYVARFIGLQDGVMKGNEPIPLPMLFYSRPKGVYDGNDTKRVMLDYYMINIDDGHYVQADINGQVFDLKDWQPYYIEGLPTGDNTIKLSLLDKNGILVKTHHNPVSRTFKLNPTPQ